MEETERTIDPRYILKERMKELECLYGFTKLLREDKSLDDILQEMPDLIQSAMEIPDLSTVRIKMGKKSYETQVFSESKRVFSVDLYVNEISLSFHVYMTEDIGFPKEKSNLLNDIIYRFKSFLLQRIEESEKFKSIFINSPIGIELYDHNGKVINVNNACLDIFGVLDPDSIRGFDLFQDPNISEDIRKRLRNEELVRYKTEFDFEMVKKLDLYQTKKSGIINLDVSITPLFQRETNIVSNYLVHIQDITERTQAELELKESEEKYRMTFDQAAVGIAHVAPNGKFLRINQSFCSIVGYTTEEMLNSTFQDITHPDDLEEDLEFVEQMLDKKISSYSMEKRYYHKNGSIVWVNLTVALLFEPSGEPKYFISVVEDITEKKRTEEALRVSREKYAKLAQELEIDLKETEFLAETLMERLPCVAILLRPKSREIVASNSYAKEFGAVPGKMCYDTWGQRTHPCPWCLAPKAWKSGEIQHLEVESNDVIWDAYWVPLKDNLYLHYAFDITEQKDADRKLKESEKKFKLLANELEIIIDHIPGKVVYKDTKNNILRVNNFMANAHNLKKTDIEGKSAFEIYSYQEAQSYWKDDLEVINSKRPKLNILESWETLEGLRWFNTSKIPYINGEGDVQGVIVISIDTTERKLAEEKLRKSEEKYRHLIEDTTVGVWMIDSEFKTRLVNPYMAEMLGYKIEDMLEKSIFNFISEKNKEFVFQNLKIQKEGTVNFDAEFEFLHRRGTSVYTQLKASTNYDEYGDFDGAFAFITDITKRILAEQKVEDQNEFLTDILESLTHPFYVINVNDYTIKLANSAAYKDSLLKHTKCYELTHRRTSPCREDHPCPIEYVKKTKKPITMEHVHYDIEDNEKIIEVHGYPVIDSNGNVKQLIEYNFDITKRKKVEQLILEENKKLRELNQIKRDLMIRVSHELKTPLTSIHGASYYLMNFYKNSLSGAVLENLDIIHKGSIRLKQLIDDLIDTSRLEAGKLVLKKNETNIVTVIKNCNKILNYFADERNIRIALDVPEQLFINIDNIRIEQVIINLLSNAIKNTPQYGKILVILREDVDNIYIKVKDTGVGITLDERSFLFEKFGKIERYGQGLDVDIDGSGLGLFISKEIINLHNGDIFFESEGRNRGTTFTVVIPKT